MWVMDRWSPTMDDKKWTTYDDRLRGRGARPRAPSLHVPREDTHTHTPDDASPPHKLWAPTQ